MFEKNLNKIRVLLKDNEEVKFTTIFGIALFLVDFVEIKDRYSVLTNSDINKFLGISIKILKKNLDLGKDDVRNIYNIMDNIIFAKENIFNLKRIQRIDKEYKSDYLDIFGINSILSKEEIEIINNNRDIYIEVIKLLEGVRKEYDDKASVEYFNTYLFS